MAKKQSSKQRAQVKDLPRKEKRLSAEDLKKVKGGTDTDKPPTYTEPTYEIPHKGNH